MSVQARGDWPLVGREDAVRRAVASLADRGAVVVSGPAGIGKTRLAATVSEVAVAPDELRLRAVASESATPIPFGALAALLPPVGDERDPLALLQLVQARLTERSAEAGALLWVDDVQHLDPGSATLLHQLVAARSARVLMTLRTGTTVPDPVAALWRSGEADLVELGPLDHDAAHELLEAVLGGHVARRASLVLWEHSAGNPLFLRELVRESVDGGALVDRGGVWQLTRPPGPTAQLGEMLAARLGRLAAPERTALELLAVADTLSVTLLGELAPAADLDDLEERGLLVVLADGARTEVRLAHPLYGEAVRREIPLLRRRRHLAVVVDAVLRVGARRRDDVLRTAVWQLDADRRPDPDLLARAADQASNRFDLPLAARLADAALAGGAGVSARVTVAEVAFRGGRPEDALELLATTAPLAAAQDEVVQVADTHAYVLSVLGRSGEAVDVLTAARDRLGPGPRVQLDGRAAVLMVFAGRPGPARAAVARMDETYGARASLPWRARARADYVEAIALGLQGRARDAAAVAAAGGAALAQDGEATLPPEQLLIGACLAHLLTGRFAAAEAEAAAFGTAMVHLGDPDGELTGALLRARVAVAVGDLDAAVDLFRRTVSGYRELHDLTGLRWSLAGLALAHGMRGEATEAGLAVQELDELAGEPVGLFEPDLLGRGRAWALVAAGRYDDARATLSAAVARAVELGQPAPEAVLRLDLLRLGDRHQLAPLAALADVAHDAGGNAYAETAARWADALDDGVALDEVSDAWQEIGALVEATESALAAAAAHTAAGLARRATASSRRADTLRSRCRSVRTPGLAATRTTAPDLTPREREIAELAARMLSAAQIAERLHLSRRTVENHLQRIYAKLGISSRGELALVLARD